MWPNPQKTADLVTFTEEILNGKLTFLCSGHVWFLKSVSSKISLIGDHWHEIILLKKLSNFTKFMADARLKIQSSCIQPVVQTQDLIESFYYPVITEPDSSYKVFFIQKTVYL